MSAVLVLDTLLRVAVLDGARLKMQEKQFRLLEVLAGSPGETVRYEDIYTALWGEKVVEDGQMQFQKTRLVMAMKAAQPARAGLIRAEYGVGFRLVLTPAEVAWRSVEVAA